MSVEHGPGGRDVPAQVVARLQQIALLGLACGVWVTRPLWTAEHAFPQIPWLQSLAGAPPAVDGVLLSIAAIAVVGLIVTVIRPRHPRLRCAFQLLFSLSAVGLVLLDQHRLQVWVLHLLVVLWLLWLAPDERGLSLVRAVAVSVYVHSAVSRCDRASLDLQWDLISPLLQRWDVATQFVPERVRLASAGLFAVAEFAVAVLLIVPRWRRLGRWASIAMHVLLLLLLGPLGLNHHSGVLVWNTVWIAQNFVLFSGCPTTLAASRSPRLRLATALAAVVILAPLLEPWGWWDHWPSWRLYSARPAVVTCYVRDVRVAVLPAAARPFVGPAEPLSDWRPLSLEVWSFGELQCPIYPQERFRLAAILAVAHDADLGDDVRVVIGAPPDRWTGRRVTRELIGARAIAQACEQFVLNVSPRRTSRDNSREQSARHDFGTRGHLALPLLFRGGRVGKSGDWSLTSSPRKRPARATQDTRPPCHTPASTAPRNSRKYSTGLAKIAAGST